MKQIASPFQFFADRSGDPLDAGYIYIGAVNQNPETTPVAVYWDEAGTQPAAQPLRTSAGYIVNGTTRARVYVSDDDYSMTIKDKASQLVSAVTSVESTASVRIAFDEFVANLASKAATDEGSGLVGHNATLNYVAGTLGAAINDVCINVKMFPWLAKGDGLTDDTAAIQAAINYVQTKGGGTIELPSPGVYNITGLTISGSTAMVIRGTWASELKNVGSVDAITVGTVSADRTADVRLLGFLLTGNASSGHGIVMKRMHNCLIEGVRSRSHGGDGIRLEGSYATKVIRNYCNNNSGHGISLIALVGVGNDFVQVMGNACLANASKGIYIDNTNYGPAGQRVELNDIEGNSVGFQIDCGSSGNTEQFTFWGNYLENNTGMNAVFADDGGSSVLNSPLIEANAFMFGTSTAAANAVKIGAACRQVMVFGNGFVTSDLVCDSSSTLAIAAGNKSNANMPTGFDKNGGSSVAQLRVVSAGYTESAAISMSSGKVRCNFPMAFGGAVYPASANTGATQVVNGVWQGTGVPNNIYGQNGDFYLRADAPGSANERIYIRTGGTWVGIL